MFGGVVMSVNRDGCFGSTIHFLRSRSPVLPWRRRLADWLMPPRCVACGQSGDLGSIDLCGCCLEDGFAQSGSALAPFVYADPVGSGLRALKYAGDLRPGRVLGALLAAHLSRQGGAAAQLLIPVPLAPARQLERGFNQATVLAREAASWLGIPVAERLLIRQRDTKPQVGLSACARETNVEQAFAPRPGARQWLVDRRVRRVALIDDVLTTGATMRAAAQAVAGLGLEQVATHAVAIAELSVNLTAGALPAVRRAG